MELLDYAKKVQGMFEAIDAFNAAWNSTTINNKEFKQVHEMQQAAEQEIRQLTTDILNKQPPDREEKAYYPFTDDAKNRTDDPEAPYKQKKD